MRVGCGFDAHAFCSGEFIKLGGVTIPFEYGVAAHSDGDVLIHALSDALLGAAALGDIGIHFPSDDAQYKDLDSRIMLRRVHRLVAAEHYQIVNLDATIIAQAPRLLPYIPQMRQLVGKDLMLPIARVSIKATTTDAMGFVGRREGIAAYSNVLIARA